MHKVYSALEILLSSNSHLSAPLCPACALPHRAMSLTVRFHPLRCLPSPAVSVPYPLPCPTPPRLSRPWCHRAIMNLAPPVGGHRRSGHRLLWLAEDTTAGREVLQRRCMLACCSLLRNGTGDLIKRKRISS
jgi:hypothetical protein